MDTAERQTDSGTTADQVQRVLAALLRSPATPLGVLAQKALRELPEVDVEASLHATRQAVRSFKSGKATGRGLLALEESETLIERVRACWLLLRHAESAVKMRAQKLHPPLSGGQLAKPFRDLLKRGSPPPGEELIRAVCEVLDLGQNGDYLAAYSAFLRGRKEDLFARPEQTERVLWWIVRAVRVRYVRDRPLQADLGFLVPHVRQEFIVRTGRGVAELPDLDARIVRQVERWLSYSCLMPPDVPADEADQKRIVQAFFICNEMREPLPDSAGLRVADLERRCAILTEENDRLRSAIEATSRAPADMGEVISLREEVTRLREQVAGWPGLQEELRRLRAELTDRKEREGSGVTSELRELRAVVVLIDEKYPLDRLQSIPLGAETGISLKQFIGHVLYALRKRGLTQYPDVGEFELSYDDSGLYDCGDFEVDPGAKVRVAVENKGWAFRNGRTLIPVRRARVRPV